MSSSSFDPDTIRALLRPGDNAEVTITPDGDLLKMGYDTGQLRKRMEQADRARDDYWTNRAEAMTASYGRKYGPS